MSLFQLILLSIVSIALAAPSVGTERIFSRDEGFFLASIGDSWAAGAAVADRHMYDKDKRCLRNKAAWEAALARDDTWTIDAIDFKFLACSGASLAAATKGDKENNQPVPQLQGAGTPFLLTMELGGNNCHFGEIARACIYMGDGDDYPDPIGGCYQAISKWETYILSDAQVAGESFYFDHHETLKDIMNWETIKGRLDFYLYIVGYAEFFNTSPESDWCNKESFGLFRHIPLTNVLRSKINDLVRKVNAQISRSVMDMNNDHIKFLDPSPTFHGHRFCEPGHTINQQYYLNSVWFWNLSNSEDDPDYLMANETLPFGSIESGSGGRAFHPKDGGHEAIKNTMISFLRYHNVPGVKQAPPRPAPEKQPYASGDVKMIVFLYWSCLKSDTNLSVSITMLDSTGAEIGNLNRTQAGKAWPAVFGSKFEDLMYVTPLWADGSYTEFQLAGLYFNSKDNTDSTKPVYCETLGWFPSSGPMCYVTIPPAPPIRNKKALAYNRITCHFPAPEWRGGNPSDGS